MSAFTPLTLGLALLLGPPVHADEASPLVEAAQVLQRTRTNHGAVNTMLAEAQQARRPKPGQVTCLQGKEATVRALVEVAEVTHQRMVLSWDPSSVGRAMADLRALQIAESRSARVRAEAETCGDEGRTMVESSFTGEEGPELQPDGNDDLGIEPPETSPYQ